MIRFIAILTIFFFMPSCTKTEDDISQKYQKYLNFIENFSERYCSLASNHSWLTDYQIFVDYISCLAHFSERKVAENIFEENGFELNHESSLMCINVLELLASDPRMDHLQEKINFYCTDLIINGQQAEGESCTNLYSCSQGFICSFTSNGPDPNSFICPGSCKKNYIYESINKKNSGEECLQDSECLNDYLCISGFCVDGKKEGENCDISNPCENNLMCDDGLCKVKYVLNKKNNEDCGTIGKINHYCDTGLYCNYENLKCNFLPAKNQNCGHHYDPKYDQAIDACGANLICSQNKCQTKDCTDCNLNKNCN